MPSGSKKRKAAKKRKEKEAHTTSSIHGDENLKTHDEKESDGGETSSPMSQDHHNQQHPFTEEVVEKRKDTSSARSFVTENKSMEESEHNGVSTQKVGVEEVGIVQIDSSLKPENESETKNVGTEYVESAKESHNGGSSDESRSSASSSSSGSSSSSSDDESRVVEKKIVVVEAGDSKEESYGLVSETTFGDKISEVEAQIISDVQAEEVLDKVSSPEEVVHVTESVQIDNSVSSGLIEPELKENGGKTLPPGNENSGVSSVSTHLDTVRKGDIVVTTSEENEDKLLLSFNTPRDDTSNGAEHVKDSEIPECSDGQPLVASAPRPVETTSWKSCCGLFEVLSGSNR